MPALSSPAYACRHGWLDAVVENVQDIITLLDASGIILWSSPSTRRVLGWAPEELTARNALELVHPEDLPVVAALLARAPDTAGQVGRIVYRFRHRDGSWRYIEAVGKNLLDHPMVAAMVINCRDVTRRVLAAEAASEAARQAERASLAKTEFVSRMSHELRTPLNAILGFGQLLGARLRESEEGDFAQQIVRAGGHLLDLINELLEIGRIEEGRRCVSLEPLRIGEVVRQALDLVQPLATARGIRLVAAPSDTMEAGWVIADAQALRQVLLNLLSNALKYGGAPGEVRVGACRGRDGVRLSVEDTGPGIPADKLDRLFQPFERLGAERSQVEGTGLGLALSRKLVELMGGEIGVESIPGQGSKFWIELPTAPPPGHDAVGKGTIRSPSTRSFPATLSATRGPAPA